MELRHTIRTLPVDVLRWLCVDWFDELARNEGVIFTNSEDASQGPMRTCLRTADGLEVIVEASETSLCQFSCGDPKRAELVARWARNAVQLTMDGETRGFVWHHVRMVPIEGNGAEDFSGLIATLSGQRRMNCWKRLSEMLLEFTEDKPPEAGALFPPKTTVNAYIRIPAPKLGRFSEYISNNALELLSAICSFALGRPVERPEFASYADAGLWPDLDNRFADLSIRFVDRDGIPLNFLHAAPLPGGQEYITRIETALITFEAALAERNSRIACVLCIVAAESLCVPEVDAQWKKEKTTDRFVSFYENLIPNELDQMVAHVNFEEIFEIKRGKKKAKRLRGLLLETMYEFRSGLVHGGLRSRPRTHLPGFFHGSIDLRRSQFMWFAEQAILKYLQSPRCSVVGSPMYNRHSALKADLNQWALSRWIISYATDTRS
jgi:hypothetical protein